MATFKKSCGARYIEDVWDISDFRNIAEGAEMDLTDEDLCDAMELVADNYDANLGITWQTVECALDVVVRNKRGKK